MAEQFFAQDVQLAAEAAHRALDKADDGWHYECLAADGDPPCPKAAAARAMLVEDVMPAVLGALADAGRLQPQPEDQKLIEEYAIRVDVEHPLRRSEPVGTVITHWGDEKALHAPKIWHGWTLLRRLAGPWVEVGSTPEESGPDE